MRLQGEWVSLLHFIFSIQNIEKCQINLLKCNIKSFNIAEIPKQRWVVSTKRNLSLSSFSLFFTAVAVITYHQWRYGCKSSITELFLELFDATFDSFFPRIRASMNIHFILQWAAGTVGYCIFKLKNDKNSSKLEFVVVVTPSDLQTWLNTQAKIAFFQAHK